MNNKPGCNQIGAKPVWIIVPGSSIRTAGIPFLQTLPHNCCPGLFVQADPPQLSIAVQAFAGVKPRQAKVGSWSSPNVSLSKTSHELALRRMDSFSSTLAANSIHLHFSPETGRWFGPAFGGRQGAISHGVNRGKRLNAVWKPQA